MRSGSMAATRPPRPSVHSMVTTAGSLAASSSMTFASQCVKIKKLALDRPGAGKIQKLRDDIVTAHNAIVDSLQLLLYPHSLALDLAVKHKGRCPDRRQGIAQFMGNGGGELAKLRHAARLHHFFLGGFQLS